MAMQALRDGASSGLIKIVLFGFLIMAVGGLVLTDVGGFFRGGIGQTDVAKIGSKTIGIQSFDRTVQRSLRQLGITPQEAYEGGYIDEMLRGEIRRALMQEIAKDMDINLGRDAIAAHIASIIEPLAQNGQNPADVLRQLLLSQGVSENEFASAIAEELAAELIFQAFQRNVSYISDDMARDIYVYEGESRKVEFIPFYYKDVNDLEDPAEAVLQAYYEGSKAAFSVPETRVMKLAVITPEKIQETLDITDEQLRAEYEANIDAYATPETRIVDQALLEDAAMADAVRKGVEEGLTLQEALKDAGAEDKTYLGENDFRKSDFGADVADSLFSADTQIGGFVGPVETPFGQQVYVLKEIKAESIKPFEDVKEQLKTELAGIQASEQIYQVSASVDDMFAGGASFEEVTTSFELDVLELGAVNKNGRIKTPEGEVDAFKDYREDGQILLETAYSLFEGEVSPVIEIASGKFAAIYVEKINPESFEPFEDVQDQLKDLWLAQKRAEHVRDTIGDHIKSEKDFADIAAEIGKEPETLENVTRAVSPPAPLGAYAIPQVFKAEMNTLVMLEIADGRALARVVASEFPKPNLCLRQVWPV